MTPTSGLHPPENRGHPVKRFNLAKRKPRPQRCMFDSEQFQAPLCATAMLEFPQFARHARATGQSTLPLLN
jgi:hypothetical protein